MENVVSLSSSFTGARLWYVETNNSNPTLIKNPNWQEATSWLFTSVDEDLSREQIQQVARAGLEPGTAGLLVQRADHSATLPPQIGVVKRDLTALNISFIRLKKI